MKAHGPGRAAGGAGWPAVIGMLGLLAWLAALARVGARADEPVGDRMGEALASQYRCAACHQPYERGRGPSWHAVARKYASDPHALNDLQTSVLNGSAGVWGSVPMAPTKVPPTISNGSWIGSCPCADCPRQSVLRSSSFIEVLARVCASTRFTITAQGACTCRSPPAAYPAPRPSRPARGRSRIWSLLAVVDAGALADEHAHRDHRAGARRSRPRRSRSARR